jgi:hypothetical protein
MIRKFKYSHTCDTDIVFDFHLRLRYKVSYALVGSRTTHKKKGDLAWPQDIQPNRIVHPRVQLLNEQLQSPHFLE